MKVSPNWRFYIFAMVPVLCCGPAGWNFTLKTEKRELRGPLAGVHVRDQERSDLIGLRSTRKKGGKPHAAQHLWDLQDSAVHRRVASAARFISAHVPFTCLAISNNGGFTGALTLQHWYKSAGYDAGLKTARWCLGWSANVFHTWSKSPFSSSGHPGSL